MIVALAKPAGLVFNVAWVATTLEGAKPLPHLARNRNDADFTTLLYPSNPTNTAASSTDLRSETTAFAGKLSSGQPSAMLFMIT